MRPRWLRGEYSTHWTDPRGSTTLHLEPAALVANLLPSHVSGGLRGAAGRSTAWGDSRTGRNHHPGRTHDDGPHWRSDLIEKVAEEGARIA